MKAGLGKIMNNKLGNSFKKKLKKARTGLEDSRKKNLFGGEKSPREERPNTSASLASSLGLGGGLSDEVGNLKEGEVSPEKKKVEILGDGRLEVTEVKKYDPAKGSNVFIEDAKGK